MRLRGAGGPPFAAGRVLAVPARTAALRADRRPPRARPGRRRAVVRARCRRVGSDRRGRRARCRRLPLDRGNTPQRDTVKFCTPVDLSPLYGAIRCVPMYLANMLANRANPTRHSDRSDFAACDDAQTNRKLPGSPSVPCTPTHPRGSGIQDPTL